MNVTVTDSAGASASGSKDYNIHKEVETTGPTSGGTATLGTGGFVGPAVTCPNDVVSCTLTLTSNTTISASLGVTVTGSVDVGLVKTSVAGTTTTTIASQNGYSFSVTLSPGQSKAMYTSPRLLERSGDWKKYDCNGLVDQGTWKNVDKIDPAWEYTAKTPS